MRTATIVFGCILLLFAALQYNDPDVFYWAAVYLVAAVFTLLAAIRPALLAPGPLRSAGFVCIGALAMGFCWLAPAISADWIHVEEAREAFGYLICAAGTGLGLYATRS